MDKYKKIKNYGNYENCTLMSLTYGISTMLGDLFLMHKAYNKVKSTLSLEPQQTQLSPCL